MQAGDVPAATPIATIGLHSSASTWVFNVVRELLIAAAGEAQVCAVYAEALPDIPEPRGSYLLIKSHHGSSGLDAWLHEAGARVILSMRDPRDACISMVQRFDAPLGHAVRWIADDCARLARLAAMDHLLLRYEDRFFDDKRTVERIGRVLGVSAGPDVMDAVFARYRTEAVRAFATSITRLPPERLSTDAMFPMDRVTQIHARHIGDARTGKWQDQPMETRTELTRIFRPFLDRFAYPC